MTLPITCRRGQTYKGMFYCSLPISYRWGQTNKNSIGGDRRTKFNRLGQTNKSSTGGDRRTEVQRYKNILRMGTHNISRRTHRVGTHNIQTRILKHLDDIQTDRHDRVLEELSLLKTLQIPTNIPIPLQMYH